MITIAIVEDNDVFRKRVVKIIKQTAGFSCVGEFSTAEEALEKISQEIPNIVLMDIHLPGMSGVECTRILKNKYPELHIMMLTMFENDEDVFGSLTAGATGYLVKRTPPDKLVLAITELMEGGSPMSNDIARKVVTAFQQFRITTNEIENLTKREEEILSLVAKGYRYKEIGDALIISYDTVRTHIQNIYKKLHVNSRSEAIIKVLRQ